MASFRALMEKCDSAIRGHLYPEEHVLAMGRCEDVSDGGGPERGGATWTYVMVTDRSLRWAPELDPGFEASLALDDVTAVAEETLAHRYAITLQHQPLRRLHRVSAHHVLMLEWGNALADGAFTRTALAFSRRDTKAARALRDQLEVRGVL